MIEEKVYKKIIKTLKEKPTTYRELSQDLDLNKNSIRNIIHKLKQTGCPIQDRRRDEYGSKEFYINTFDTGGFKERHTDYFGILSDTHIGSSSFRQDALEEYYDILNERGIKTAFHCGDLISGNGVYKGQEFENDINGINKQCQFFVDVYPTLKDGVTIGVTGNHDLKQFQKSGVEVGELITLMMNNANRDDFEYLGRYTGRVVLDDAGHTIDLTHYTKGASAYTLSYRAQVRQRDEAPSLRADILALGHKHVTMFMDYNDQIIFEAGCFQDQTDFLLSKGINSNIAAWIVELETDGEDIVRVKPELIKFPKDKNANLQKHFRK